MFDLGFMVAQICLSYLLPDSGSGDLPFNLLSVAFRNITLEPPVGITSRVTADN